MYFFLLYLRHSLNTYSIKERHFRLFFRKSQPFVVWMVCSFSSLSFKTWKFNSFYLRTMHPYYYFNEVVLWDVSLTTWNVFSRSRPKICMNFYMIWYIHCFNSSSHFLLMIWYTYNAWKQKTLSRFLRLKRENVFLWI